jgi:tetratricopeptide (TPR) repeat protein
LTPYEHWNARLLQARTELAQDRLDRALNLLGRIYRKAEERAAKHAMIGSLALRAVALQAQGELDQVMEALESALSMAEPEGYVRTFIDVGEPMAALLRAAASRGIAVDYVRRLLEPFGEVGPPLPTSSSPSLSANSRYCPSSLPACRTVRSPLSSSSRSARSRNIPAASMGSWMSTVARRPQGARGNWA